MDREHHASQAFVSALDLACGRMVTLDLAQEAMVELAQELASMLSNESYSVQPCVPHSKELYRLMVAIKCYIEGKGDTDLRNALESLDNLKALAPELLSLP